MTKMRIILHCVFFATLSVMNVEGSTSLKRRVGVLEHRMNVVEVHVNTDLERDIDALNKSLVYTKDQVCSNKIQKGDRQEVKYHSAKTTESQRFSKARVSVDFANEKKWLRKKMEIFDNVIQEQGQMINKSISEIRSDLRSHEQAVHAKVNDGLQTNFKMINASMINIEKDIESNMSSLSSEIVDIKENVSAEIQEIYTIMLQKLSAEIQEKEKLINEQRLEINNLKQSVDQMNGFLLPCPTGWTKFKSYCYLYVKDRLPYYTARERCSSQGASVADIQSKEEADFIVKLCTDSGHTFDEWPGQVWIGFTDEVTENVWISDRTGRQATYTNWRSNQPNGGTGYTVFQLAIAGILMNGITRVVFILDHLFVKQLHELVNIYLTCYYCCSRWILN
ncbi:C-type lectin domain family 4 member F-like [Mercenaria mercenaria]|uniref:C-type lectin domain family 4 member F-like n=1 Tax=Mercenaria mercenaria TaxID=6596 RepID=UPI00234F5216|nr:C-type lectin domain family 4 member F-like [Mercenaria mercenaria]